MREGYREIELYIGPLQEFESGSKEKANSLHIVSNGNVNTLKVRISCQKQAISAATQCFISIWNLRPQTRNVLRKAGALVKVYVGYEGQEKNLLFTGSIASAVTDRDGPDFITKLVCRAAGSNMVRSVVSKSYSAGVDLKSAVMELAKQFPNITPDPANVNLTGTIGYAGWSFVGSTKDALDKLAYQFGFSWYIENGTFHAFQDGTVSRETILLNSANGLRKVSPRLTGLLQIQEGTDISVQFVPNVGPGKSVRVVSETNPDLSREYYCFAVSYNLCPKDDSWDMDITTFNIAPTWGA